MQIPKELNIWFGWAHVFASPDQKYLYPNRVTSHIVERHSKPTIYRWAIFDDQTDEGSPRRVYVGETESLARRVHGYLRPGSSQWTNIRVSDLMSKALEAGARIELHTFEFEQFDIVTGTDDGRGHVPVTMNHLHIQYIRELMENFAIAVHDSTRCEVLNKVLNPMIRRREKASRLQARSEDASAGPVPVLSVGRKASGE